jgi:hypothetical protein
MIQVKIFFPSLQLFELERFVLLERHVSWRENCANLTKVAE